ncbi:hypothetical protein BLA29_006143, partial [Euroglyphus maynei]
TRRPSVSPVTISTTNLPSSSSTSSPGYGYKYGYGNGNNNGYGDRKYNSNQNVGLRPWSDGTYREEDTALNRFINFFPTLLDDFDRMGRQDSFINFGRFQLNRFIDIFRSRGYDLHNHFYHCTQRVDGCPFVPRGRPQTTTTIDPFLFTINPFSLSTTPTINFEPIRSQITSSSSSSSSSMATKRKSKRKNLQQIR